MSKIVLWAIILLNFANFSVCDKKTVSLVELAKCKQFKTFGYGYKKYFGIDDIHHVRKNNEILNLRIGILAAKDAHILLSTNDNPAFLDPVYEIVLGAGSNTFCEIRRKMRISSLKTKRILNVLSPVDPTAINIVVTTEGVIEVRYEGDETAIISANDDDVLPIRYIAFSSWGMTEAKYFYDCPNDLSDQLSVSREEINMQSILETDLFSGYDLFVAPEMLENVEYMLEVKNSQFDGPKQIMSTRLSLVLSWKDPKLVWEYENYEYIENVRYTQQHKIWHPIVHFMNGVDLKDLDSSDVPFKVQINYNGTVVFQTMEFVLKTWCSLQEVEKWPHDHVTCSIRMKVFNSEVPLVESKTFKADNNAFHQSENSQWRITLIEPIQNGAKVIYEINMIRNEEFLSNIFGTVLHATLIFLIVSSFINVSAYRITLIMITALIICSMMMCLAKTIPPAVVPLIMTYYQTCLFLCWVAILCHILRAWLMTYPPVKSPPEWIHSLSENAGIRAVLCLDSNEAYLKLQNDQSPWILISNFTDKFFALGLFIFHIFITVKGY